MTRPIKVASYSLWVSLDAFNNMITGVHCEGTNSKCKVKTIIQDNGCLLVYQALARTGAQQVAEWPSEDWALILWKCFTQKPPVQPYFKILPFKLWIKIHILTS